MKTKLEELVEWIDENTPKNKFTEQIWRRANKLLCEEKEECNEIIKGLNKIAQMSDSGSEFNTIIDMKSIASDLLNKINK